MSQALEQTLGYSFRQPKLLTRALTHASKSPEHLERQEFLGDAVLGLIVSEYLFEQHPSSAEGNLSKMRANLVCKQALLHIASVWGLTKFLIVGAGERDEHGRLKSESIAANAVESVIAAVFEDGGWEAAKCLVLSAWKHMLDQAEPVNLRDAKSELQERTQAKSLGLPQYKITDLGVKKPSRFFAECFLGTQKLGEGFGQRKKEAEIKAAQHALQSKQFSQVIKGL